MSNAPTGAAIAAPKAGDKVVYLERGSFGGPTEYSAQVVAVHECSHTPVLLDLACVDGRGRAFARMRVPHESIAGAPAVWRALA